MFYYIRWSFYLEFNLSDFIDFSEKYIFLQFIFRYQYLVEIYSVSAEKIISDAFSYSEMYKDKEINNVNNFFVNV